MHVCHPHREEKIYIYGGKKELVESKKRSEFGGGRVKGNEVKRERWRDGKEEN